MRWPSTKPPCLGDTRSVRRFLLFPLTLEGETRWLEFAWIRQRYALKYDGYDGNGSWEHTWWA